MLRTDQIQVEGILLLAALLLAWGMPKWGAIAHRWMMGWFDRLAQRSGWFVLGCGVAAFLAAALQSGLIFWPEPSVHDEFGYLLTAETFASGRLTNPTHPLWEHFEAFHQFHEPSHQSKYPPGQALFLALAIAVCGDATPGIWLQSGLMCSALAWMMFGWLPGRWAVLGSLLGLLRFGIVGSWAQSFWGGAACAMGGALVFGSAMRMLRAQAAPRVHWGAMLGLGLFLLANTRPFEGAITVLPVAVLLGIVVIRRLLGGQVAAVGRTVVPLVLVFGVGLGFMLSYNLAVTGDPWRMPYMEYDGRYSRYPAFLFLPLFPEVHYNHEFIREYMHGFQKGGYEQARSLVGYVQLVSRRLLVLASFFLGVMSLPFLLVPFVARFRPLRRRVRLVFACLATGLVATCLTTYSENHYQATLTGPLLFLVVVGWRWISRRGLRGQAFCAALLVAVTLVTGIRMAGTRGVILQPIFDPFFGHTWRGPMRRDLLQRPGRDLVIVSYPGGHGMHYCFVFNAADIDKAPIIWARDMGQKNDRLLARYQDRYVWKLTWKGFPFPGPDGKPQNMLQLSMIRGPVR